MEWPEEPCYFEGDGHFYNTWFTTVTFPEWLEKITPGMFDHCLSLTSITLGNKVSEIGSSAFLSCTKLMNVELPASVKTIGGSAFSSCPLGTLSIPGGSSIGNYAFSGTSLTSLTFPDEPCTFGTYVFYHQNTLSSVTLPSWMEKVPQYFFNSSPNLATIDFSEATALREIDDYAFQSCGRLHDVEIPRWVNRIGKYALANCGTQAGYSFGTVEINKDVVYDDWAFYGTTISRLIFNDCGDIHNSCLAGVTTTNYTQRLYVKVPKTYLPNQESWMIAESSIGTETKILSGVEDVSLDGRFIDGNDRELYFDLQGRPLKEPIPGQPYIRVSSTGNRVLVK